MYVLKKGKKLLGKSFLSSHRRAAAHLHTVGAWVEMAAIFHSKMPRAEQVQDEDRIVMPKQAGIVSIKGAYHVG